MKTKRLKSLTPSEVESQSLQMIAQYANHGAFELEHAAKNGIAPRLWGLTNKSAREVAARMREFVKTLGVKP